MLGLDRMPRDVVAAVEAASRSFLLAGTGTRATGSGLGRAASDTAMGMDRDHRRGIALTEPAKVIESAVGRMVPEIPHASAFVGAGMKALERLLSSMPDNLKAARETLLVHIAGSLWAAQETLLESTGHSWMVVTAKQLGIAPGSLLAALANVLCTAPGSSLVALATVLYTDRDIV